MTAPSRKQDAQSPGEPMRESVARFEERRQRWGREAGRTLLVVAAVAGIGWVIVVPAVVGFALGHSLDSRYGTGVLLGAGLGMLGLGLGCWAAWRRIARQREEHGGEGP